MSKKNILKIFLIISIIFITFLLIGLYVCYKVNEFYNSNDPVLNEITSMLYEYFNQKNFPTDGHLAELNDKNLLDPLSIQASKTGSYTINKKNIHICMKDKDGDYYDRNMLIYVLIHELAHVICDEIGHTEKFHEINDELLEHAIKSGVYDPTQPIPIDYCDHHKD